LVTWLIYNDGGIESRAVILYAVPMLVAGALYGRRATYAVAGVSSLLYVLLVVLDFSGLIPAIGVVAPELHHKVSYLINSVCFVPSIIFVIALGIDFLTSLLIEKEQQASAHLAALNRAQEIARVGSWEWDVVHDEISWSDALHMITGVPDDGRPISYDSYLKLLPPEDAQKHSQSIQEALKKKSNFTTDHRLIMPDGSIRYMHGEGRPDFDASGKVIRMSGTAQDVTESYHLDNAKREFVSLASHQLRTPASGVKAFLSLLLDGYAGSITRKQRDFIHKAHDANNRQLDIIDNLLNLAALESGNITLKRVPIDLNALVRKCLPNHVPAIKARHQKLKVSYAESACTVQGDPTYLQMIIDNLVSNAIKYTPEKGDISISISAKKSAGYVVVSDTGIGISADDMKDLFKKFSRLRDPASSTVGGSGLGLYLARHLAELHGGSITVRSHHGQGAAFRIRLPLAANMAYDKRSKRNS
jgi:PAS domain S-box-containing protein